MAHSRHQLLPLLLGLTLLFAHTATAQTRASDSEMKEVFRFVLEREVPRPADGATVAVLLGPNVKSSWIPEVPGYDIRKLSYDEEKRVREYYDLAASFKGRVIEVTVSKGNYCKKVGRRYEFRGKSGDWQVKVIADVESKTMAGDRCDGCVVGSGATYSVRRQTVPPAPSRADNLRLTGSVRKTTCSRDASYIRCKAELNLTFTNAGSTPLIILQPQGEFEFWHGATSLALSEQESRAYSFVYSAGGWPSVYKFPLYQNLANLLDQSAPPAGVTRVLRPSENWSWDTSIVFSLQEGNTCNQHVGVEIGWEEIKRRTDPLWLRVSYEMWPFNVENFKPDLGGILKKRWQSYGSLYLDEKTGNYWQAILTSEPIEFPLSQIDLTQ